MMTNSHDMVTGANPTPRTVPEFLSGQPMHSRTDTQNQILPQGQPSETIPSVAETSVNSDPIRPLVDVLVGMNSKPSAQTLMVRPVSTTTLTFDGKSKKFEFFEDLFQTMMKHATQHDKNDKDKTFSFVIAQKFFAISTRQELNGLEEKDDLPVPTMTSEPSTSRPGTGLLSSGIDPNATCKSCKKPGHVNDDCRMLKRKEQANVKSNDGQSTKKKYPNCPTCDKMNNQVERRWQGTAAHLKPKNSILENFKTDDASTSQGDTNTKTKYSIPKNPKKIDLPRLQINDKLRVRQYIISDPATVCYTEYYSSFRETASVDWQQQMKTIQSILQKIGGPSVRRSNYDYAPYSSHIPYR